LRSSFATIDARRPSMWWRASTTTLFAQTPDPDTIFALPGGLVSSPRLIRVLWESENEQVI
jgi:hypothetical protein